jgi:hypothetical protein
MSDAGQPTFTKVRPDDEGAVDMAISHDADKDVVIIDFQKPVNWLAMPADMARLMAKSLEHHAVCLDLAKRREGGGFPLNTGQSSGPTEDTH